MLKQATPQGNQIREGGKLHCPSLWTLWSTQEKLRIWKLVPNVIQAPLIHLQFRKTSARVLLILGIKNGWNISEEELNIIIGQVYYWTLQKKILEILKNDSTSHLKCMFLSILEKYSMVAVFLMMTINGRAKLTEFIADITAPLIRIWGPDIVIILMSNKVRGCCLNNFV